MSIWKFFTSSEEDKKSTLQKEIENRFPDMEEERQIHLAAFSGLLARVAIADFHIDESEEQLFRQALKGHTQLPHEEIEFLVSFSLKNAKELAGRENHMYCTALNESLDKDEKYEILEVLCQLAMADGKITHEEDQELSYIANSLRLSHQHFIAAKAAAK